MEEEMKKAMQMVAMFVLMTTSTLAFGQVPTVTPCDPTDTACLLRAKTAIDDGQDMGIMDLEDRADANEAADTAIVVRVDSLAKIAVDGMVADAALNDRVDSLADRQFQNVMEDRALAGDIGRVRNEVRDLDGRLLPVSDSAGRTGTHPLVGAVGVSLEDNAAQDRELADARAKIECLRKAQRRFATAKGLKSATDRIAAIEEARKSLPADLVGKVEIEVLITNAVTASQAKTDAAIEALTAGLGDRVTQLQTQVTALGERVTDVETRVDDLETFVGWFRSIHMEIGLWNGIHSVGNEVGVALWVTLPLGLESNWTARLGGGAGWADRDGTVGWLAQADFLWRYRWFSVGPSFVALGASDSRGGRDLMIGGGASVRADLFSDWFFIQATGYVGGGSEDRADIDLYPKSGVGGGGLFETGVRF